MWVVLQAYYLFLNHDFKYVKSSFIVEIVSVNLFEVDSSFSSGTYNIKAYTNWMLNFNEKNYYSESIQIIDLENNVKKSTALDEEDIDAQFLPESGHLLHNVTNVVGVMVCLSKGRSESLLPL